MQQKLANALRCNPKIHEFEEVAREVDILFNKTAVLKVDKKYAIFWDSENIL